MLGSRWGTSELRSVSGLALCTNVSDLQYLGDEGDIGEVGEYLGDEGDI